MKRIISLTLAIVIVSVLAIGCSKDSGKSPSFDTSKTINVVSREDGSGTRGAFVEILDVLVDGNDATYEESVVQSSTNGVMTTVAGDKYAIGYISLGSLNDTVKAVHVEDVEATAENIKSGDYKISRPFNIAYKNDLNDLGKDFVDFILSNEGQVIVGDSSLIAVGENLPSYKASGLSGNLVVAGSTSVTPLMEKLKEAYEGLNKGVSIEIQSTGSSAGMTAAIEGSAHIAMASRELKDSEKAILDHKAIAIDGIAVIVNKENTILNLTMEEIKSIYLGDITTWGEVE